MATDKIAMNEIVERANNAFKPIYKPLFAIFKKLAGYDEYNGTMTFLETDTKGNLSARLINSQDTEGKHIAVGEDKKVYNKYFKGVNYIVSGYQKNDDIDNITAKVLEVFTRQLDEEIFRGDPNADGSLNNNGIFGTNDKNAVKKADITLANSSIDTILAFFASLLKEAEELAGNAEKTILIGGALKDLLSKVVPNTAVLYKTLIKESFTMPVNLVALPSNLEAFLPSGKSIAQVLTLDAITLRHSAMPRLKAQGFNEEKEHTWYKFFYGSAMVDVEQRGASIIQPVIIA
ncbi:MAG: hypothetical protein LBH29_03105 [Elusimicrobiota bacterium]|jgi:hypothetical protein|nr:hypothetical protein [Elusimicrobiota bacterium]